MILYTPSTSMQKFAYDSCLVDLVGLVRVFGLFWGNLSKLTAYFDETPKKSGLWRLGGTPSDPPTSLLWKLETLLHACPSTRQPTHTTCCNKN